MLTVSEKGAFLPIGAGAWAGLEADLAVATGWAGSRPIPGAYSHDGKADWLETVPFK
jgi:hypothetical protein